MNKKTMILLSIIGVLIVAFLAALLIGRAGFSVDTKVGTTTEAAGEATGIGSTESTADTVSAGQAEQTGQTGNEPTFEVDFGVGSRVDFDLTEPTRTNPAIQNTQPPTSSRPDHEQNTEGLLDAEMGEDGLPDKLLTYEEFLSLSNEDQQAYFFCFEDPVQYAQWLRQAQQDYEDGKTSIIVTGPVDLETLP